MKPQHFIVLMLLALCFCLPGGAKAADQNDYCDRNELLTKFKRECTIGPLTLGAGSTKKTYNCPCNDDAYCSSTGFCKKNPQYLIHFTNLRSGATLSGKETITFETGLGIYSLKLKKYNSGRLENLNFPCKQTSRVNQSGLAFATWSCEIATDCYDTYVDAKGVVKDRITKTINTENNCLANGDYFITACAGIYCSNAISVTIANDTEKSIAAFCKAHDYQCTPDDPYKPNQPGRLGGIWGDTYCPNTCSFGEYCTNGFKCKVDDRNCGNRTCGFAGNVKPLKPCGGTGAEGDFGDGKGGCLPNYTCSGQRCVWEGDCKTNADCKKKALPSECIDANNDGIKDAWNDIPYCLNKNCGHNPKPMWIDNETGLWNKNTASIYTLCKTRQECYIASDNRAYCKTLPQDPDCSCNDVTKTCCTNCTPGPTTKCGGGIMVTSYYVMPEPPTCVATKTCSLKDFARSNFYKTPTPAGFLTGKNDYSYGIDNIKAVAKIDPDFTYHPAIAYCDNLTAGNFSDWYLPSKSELVSIFTNYFEKNKTKDSTRIYLDGAKNYAYYPYTGLMWGSYLTSQSYYGDLRNIWNVSFIHGTLAPTGYIPGGADSNTAATFGAGVMCVRRIK